MQETYLQQRAQEAEAALPWLARTLPERLTDAVHAFANDPDLVTNARYWQARIGDVLDEARAAGLDLIAVVSVDWQPRRAVEEAAREAVGEVPDGQR